MDSLSIFQGERFDVVLNVIVAQAANYWIRMNGISRCIRSQAHQTSILRYNGAPDMFPTTPNDYASGDRSGLVRLFANQKTMCNTSRSP